MSGSFVGGVIGASIGYVVGFGNPYAVQAGFIIGSGVGASFDSLPDQQGPRLSDLSVQASEYGKPIPIVYGTIGLAGNIIWASDIIEVRTDTETGGGKGGSPSQTTTTYSYFGNFAIAVCEGEADIRRIWSGPDKRLIYDADTGTLEGGTLRLYSGTETQLPDALIESYLGVGNVPAYRGAVYLVFENFPLASDGNRLPFLTVEVNRIIAGAFESRKPPTSLGNSIAAEFSYSDNVLAVYDPVNRNIWSANDQNIFEELFEVRVNSDISLTQINSFSVDVGGQFIYFRDMFFTPGSPNTVTICGELFVGIDYRLIFNADTRTLISQAAGNSYGTVGLVQEIVNSSGVTYQFRDVGYYTINGGPFEAIQLIGTSGGSGYFIGDAFALKNHWAVVTYGATSQTHLRRYDTGALTTFNFGTMYKGRTLYDPDRERLVQITASRGIVVMDIATGTATTYTITAPAGADTTPPPSPSFISFWSAVYASGYYIFGVQGSATSGTSLWLVNPDTLVCDYLFTYETNASPPSMMAPLLAPPGGRGSYVISFDATTVKRLYFRRPGSELSAVVGELSDRAGLLTTNYNTDALTDIVDGYAIARQTSVRGAIDALRPAYYFDAVESDGVIKYVKRGGSVAVVIPDTDLAAHEAGQDNPDPLLITRQMELELPRVVYVNHLLAATEYSPSTKIASRLIGSSGDESTIDLPLVLSDTKAQEAAEVNLHVAWTQRMTYEFSLPLKYSYLEPTDIVVVKDKTMRIQKITKSPKGVIKVAAVADEANFYTPNVVVTETPTSGKVVAVAGPTFLELM